MAFIYVITNDINGKQYVGKTLLSIERRFKEHIRASRKKNRGVHRPLLDAIVKYGEKHFSISMLEEVSDPTILSEREIHWIKELGTFRNGYNATLGGDGTQYFDYEKIRDLLLSGKTRDEVISIVGCSRYTISVVSKIYNLKRGYDLFKKPVDQSDLNGNFIRTFESLTAAGRWANENGLSKSPNPENNIKDCANGRTETAYGFKWRYHNESDKPRH